MQLVRSVRFPGFPGHSPGAKLLAMQSRPGTTHPTGGQVSHETMRYHACKFCIALHSFAMLLTDTVQKSAKCLKLVAGF